jgi:uncharacterized protein (DUF488 family)
LENRIFTIGHSNYATDYFLELLRRNGISAVADVRSRPHTRVNPDFSQPNIEKVLAEAHISYVFLGEELGARSQDESCYLNGKVRYERLAKQTMFQDGLDRIEMGAEKYRIALLCAEKEPLQCHRCILVSRHLVSRNLRVSHILADGSAEEHQHTISRLKQSLGLMTQRDMFKTDEELTDMAYEMQEARIAYEIPEEQIPALVA